jgi:hypothetical protein
MQDRGKDRREGDKQSGCRTEGKTGGTVTSRVAAGQRERHSREGDKQIG